MAYNDHYYERTEMSKIYLPIFPEIIALLAELNGGVAPTAEEQPTLFVYTGPDTPNKIIPAPDDLSEVGDAIFPLVVHY